MYILKSLWPRLYENIESVRFGARKLVVERANVSNISHENSVYSLLQRFILFSLIDLSFITDYAICVQCATVIQFWKNS